MKKITNILIPSLLAAASFSVPAAGTEDLFGNIVFIGDSITQANGTDAVSYRYQLWKCFVDSDVAYTPVGSMNQYSTGETTSDLIPSDTYLGVKFNNTHEGHFGWTSGWLSKPEKIDTSLVGAGTFPQNSTNNRGGLSGYIDNQYGGKMPDTATILMGINDLARGGTIDYVITENIKGIVNILQEKNENITIHVFSLLPDARTTEKWQTHGYEGSEIPWNTVLEYNKQLKETLANGAWSTGTSTVVYHDITAGFDPYQHTYDSLHPNAQGELIIAGNMARALGIGQRTVGLERKGGEALGSQAIFSSDGGNVKIAAGTKDFDSTGTQNSATLNGGNVIFSSNSEGTSIFSLAIDEANSAGTARDVTVSLTLQMNEILATAHTSDNLFAIAVGNGANSAGYLYIGESGIFWGGETDATEMSLLYGCTVDTYKTKFMVKEAQSLRIVYLAATEERTNSGVAAGYYIWLGDQLIGEARTGTTVDAAEATLLSLGDLSTGTQTSATLSALSLELGAFAPSAIPEPSLFGLFAGTLALGLAGTRRRRKSR